MTWQKTRRDRKIYAAAAIKLSEMAWKRMQPKNAICARFSGFGGRWVAWLVRFVCGILGGRLHRGQLQAQHQFATAKKEEEKRSEKKKRM